MILQLTYNAPENETFPEQIKACLDYLEQKCPPHRRLGLLLYIDSRHSSDYHQKRSLVQEILKKRKLLLPFHVLAQNCHDQVSMEVWEDTQAESIQYRILDDVCYSVTESQAGKAVWGFGVTTPQEDLSLPDQIEFSFQSLMQILTKEGLSLSNLVRQWNYVPGILDLMEQNGKMWQHYQVFNEIRQKYYNGCTFSDGFPAATGIGTRNGNFGLDFFAIQSGASIRKTSLSNPKQEDAYHYDEKHLIGDAVIGETKRTPLFERAKLLERNQEKELFISGTASIVGQDTIGIGDVALQTEQTIANMLELTATLEKQLMENKTIRFTYLRAYIKHTHDFARIQKACEEKFPGVPLSCLQADVCRQDLLVEIEGEAIVDE